MSDVYRNPETTPQDEELEKRSTDSVDWAGSRMNPVGPAGSTTIVNGNEKGILEQGIQEALSAQEVSPLGSTHMGYRQGIYTD